MLLFDFGAQVEGYRSDMTRMLFVGEPTERNLFVYGLVAQAQGAAIAALTYYAAVRNGGSASVGRLWRIAWWRRRGGACSSTKPCLPTRSCIRSSRRIPI